MEQTRPVHRIEGCQIPNVDGFAEGRVLDGPKSPVKRFKRTLGKQWNYIFKPWLKRMYYNYLKMRAGKTAAGKPQPMRAMPAPVGAPIGVPAFSPEWAAKAKAEGQTVQSPLGLKPGDWVRVRSAEEIRATLNPFKELRGCAFLEEMYGYCGTVQRVFRVVERFLDERDYKVKKSRGIILLEGAHCSGTVVYGRCDRACLLFWREEWLEKIEDPTLVPNTQTG